MRRWRGSRCKKPVHPSNRRTGKTDIETDGPTDIRACAEGWSVLAPLTGSKDLNCVWRPVTTGEKIALDRAADGRFSAGHWSVVATGGRVIAPPDP